MKYFLLVSCFIVSLVNSSFSQEKRISGSIIDSSTRKYIHEASIVLVNQRDSFIVADTRSDQKGQFKFANIPDSGQYFLFISHPEFVSYSVKLDLSGTVSDTFNPGIINLISRANLLQEVVVKAKLNNIRLRGDTVEYSADKIKLQPNSTVEDLLRVLPGLHVDPKGNISAQGKKVRQVLVDGEEFFSDDPTLVTQNLRSDMISKVQVYDQKSDAANFTGIDDGIKDRVINLKLREDKNNGLFGKAGIGAGAGSENNTLYNTQAFLNAFKGKRKASAFLSTNNTGQWGLMSADRDKLGLGSSLEPYDGRGLPMATFAGLHYDNKWNKDWSSINADYNFSLINISGNESTFSQNNLPTGIIRRNSSNIYNTRDQANKANVTFRQQSDSSSSITFYTAGEFGTNRSDYAYTASDRDGAENLLNQTGLQTNEDASFQRYALNMLWQKKFKKPGRTLSAAWDNLVSNNEGQRNFLSTTEFFNSKPVSDSTRTLNLLKVSDNHTRKLAANINYTERLAKILALIVSYNATQNYSDDNNLSFPSHTSTPGLYDRAFSTDRINDKWLHTGTFNLNFALKNTRISTGTAAGVANIFMNEKINAQQFKRSFPVWWPMFSLHHDLKENTNFNISYRGNTVNPEFQEILPYRFNNNQLVTYFGNPDLKNSFSNNYSANYESFKNVSSAFTAMIATYTTVSNPITLGMNIDESGSYSLQYMNLGGYSNRLLDATGFYSRPIKRPNMQLTFDMSIKGGRTFNYINGLVNKLNHELYSLGLFGAKNKTGKYDVYLGTTVNYHSNRLTGQGQIIRNNFFSFSVKPSAKLYFLKRLQLHSEAEYLWQEKSNVFQNHFDRLIWNAWISGDFLKSNQLTFRLIGNDLLNANTGFSRDASTSFFTESRFLTIRRYFVLSATWNFTKFKKTTTP